MWRTKEGKWVLSEEEKEKKKRDGERTYASNYASDKLMDMVVGIEKTRLHTEGLEAKRQGLPPPESYYHWLKSR